MDVLRGANIMSKGVSIMTAFFKGKAIGQVSEILLDGRVYDEKEIKKALEKVVKKK